MPETAVGRTCNNRFTFQQRKVRLVVRLGSNCAGHSEVYAFPSSEGFQKHTGLTLIRVNSVVDPASGQAQRSFPSPGFMIGEAYCYCS